jgi:hypothetical protein
MPEAAEPPDPRPPAQAAPTVPESWLSQVQDGIARAEYQLSLQKNPFGDGEAPRGAGQAWQAPNRAHGWRVWFLPEGIRVVERTNSPSRFEWRMELKRYGWEGTAAAVSNAELRVEKNRAEYDRGVLVERYENKPEGLEQSFELRSSPPRTDDLDPVSRILHLVFALPGNVKARVAEGGATVDLVGPAGERMVTLGNYRATDAAGRELAVKLAGGGDEFALIVEAGGAQFPITVR